MHKLDVLKPVAIALALALCGCSETKFYKENVKGRTLAIETDVGESAVQVFFFSEKKDGPELRYLLGRGAEAYYREEGDAGLVCFVESDKNKKTCLRYERSKGSTVFDDDVKLARSMLNIDLGDKSTAVGVVEETEDETAVFVSDESTGRVLFFSKDGGILTRAQVFPLDEGRTESFKVVLANEDFAFPFNGSGYECVEPEEVDRAFLELVCKSAAQTELYN